MSLGKNLKIVPTLGNQNMEFLFYETVFLSLSNLGAKTIVILTDTRQEPFTFFPLCLTEELVAPEHCYIFMYFKITLDNNFER